MEGTRAELSNRRCNTKLIKKVRPCQLDESVAL